MAKHLDIYPTLPDVLYVRSNLDGSRKRCSNCCLYLKNDYRCLVHAKDLFIGHLAVCGYHIYGAPLAHRPKGFSCDPLDPKLSGLIDTIGTSCDRCAWYQPGEPGSSPLCLGVYTKGEPAHVEALGCCARWLKKLVDTAPWPKHRLTATCAGQPRASLPRQDSLSARSWATCGAR